MSKWILTWSDGFNINDAIVYEAESYQEASQQAYYNWLNVVYGDYTAEPYTEELAKEYGLES